MVTCYTQHGSRHPTKPTCEFRRLGNTYVSGYTVGNIEAE